MPHDAFFKTESITLNCSAKSIIEIIKKKTEIYFINFEQILFS